MGVLSQACLGTGPHGASEGALASLTQSLSPQSSQPSTTSPFKQEVFVYSPSASSESPSLGAAATPIIMSRSPTGQWLWVVFAVWLEGLCVQRGREGGVCLDHCSCGMRPRHTGLASFCPPLRCRPLSSTSSFNLSINLKKPVFLSSFYVWETEAPRV